MDGYRVYQPLWSVLTTKFHVISDLPCVQNCSATGLVAVFSLLRFPSLQLDLRNNKRAREMVFRFVHSNDDARIRKL
jgi:hypothetical protein